MVTADTAIGFQFSTRGNRQRWEWRGPEPQSCQGVLAPLKQEEKLGAVPPALSGRTACDTSPWSSTSRTGRGWMFQARRRWYQVIGGPGKEGSAQGNQTPSRGPQATNIVRKVPSPGAAQLLVNGVADGQDLLVCRQKTGQSQKEKVTWGKESP